MPGSDLEEEILTFDSRVGDEYRKSADSVQLRLPKQRITKDRSAAASVGWTNRRARRETKEQAKREVAYEREAQRLINLSFSRLSENDAQSFSVRIFAGLSNASTDQQGFHILDLGATIIDQEKREADARDQRRIQTLTDTWNHYLRNWVNPAASKLPEESFLTWYAKTGEGEFPTARQKVSWLKDQWEWSAWHGEENNKSSGPLKDNLLLALDHAAPVVRQGALEALPGCLAQISLLRFNKELGEDTDMCPCDFMPAIKRLSKDPLTDVAAAAKSAQTVLEALRKDEETILESDALRLPAHAARWQKTPKSVPNL